MAALRSDSRTGSLDASYSASSKSFDPGAAAALVGAGTAIQRLLRNEALSSSSVRGEHARSVPVAPENSHRALLIVGIVLLTAVGLAVLVFAAKAVRRRARYVSDDPRRIAAACRLESAEILLDQRIEVPRSATLRELGELLDSELEVGASLLVEAAGGARFAPPRAAARRRGSSPERGAPAAARAPPAAVAVRAARGRSLTSLSPQRVSLAVVLAAGLGTRLQPVTGRWPKPILPIDGRPVIVSLLHELGSGGFDSFVVVTGHLAAQVEELLAPLPYRLRFAAQPEPLGSADAVRRAHVEPPYLVTAADTVYRRGDSAEFWQQFEESGSAGAISMRRQPGRPGGTRIRAENGRVVTVVDPTDDSGLTAAPLMVVGPPGGRADRGRPPGAALRARASLSARDRLRGRIEAIEIGKTRDLTDPLDLVEENFPYLR